MLQIQPFLNVYHIILLVVLKVLLSGSSLVISQKVKPINSTCEIKYESSQKGTATFYLDFDQKISFNMSNLILMTCNLENCKIKEGCYELNRGNGSNSVKCTTDFNFHEISTTIPVSFQLWAGNKFIHGLGKIRNLQCNCKNFDLDQKMAITNTQLGKVHVQIEEFYDFPKVEETDLFATPTNTSKVKKQKNSKKEFEVLLYDLCQTYNLTLRVKSLPTCTNWKIESNVKLPLRSVDTNTFFCQYNHTTIKINASPENDSQVYYNLSFGNQQFQGNVAKELTFPMERMKIKSKLNITAFVKLCARGCDRCGKEKKFICYSTIPKSLKNDKTSIRNKLVIICVLGVLIFFGIFGMMLWFKHSKRSKICKSDKEEIRPRHTTRVPMENEDYAKEPDPIYEKIKEYHHYDKLDISFMDVDSVSEIPQGTLVEETK